MQGLFEFLDLPYVGSDVLALAICMDKLTLKRLLAERGASQVDFVAVGEPGWRERCATELGLPLWVKPSRMGSSVGITRVARPRRPRRGGRAGAAPRPAGDRRGLGRRPRGRAPVLGNEDPDTSLPGEILAHADWYDFEAKYGEGGMDLAVPAPLAEIETARVRELAASVFALAGCSGLARCDFFVEPDGAVLVNEINTMPGFTETSVYAKLLEAGGLSYADLCDRLVDLAIARHRSARSTTSSPIRPASRR